MAFTPNKNLEQPARGSNVGVWDTPVNSNTGIIDNSFGGTASVALAASPVTLSAGQYQCVFINFTGTISANIAVTFPFVGSFYTIENQTTGNFTVTLQTTVAGAQAICAPPGEVIDIKTDGNTGNMKYRNLGRIGSYIDMAVTSVPTWISGCTVPPYLYCNGTTFSSATYPQLATILGSTTLPDRRGRFPLSYNDGTSRVISTAGGIDGNTLKAAGGSATTTLSSQEMPNYALPVTDPTHNHGVTHNDVTNYAAGGVGHAITIISTSVTDTEGSTLKDATGITVNSGGGGLAFGNVPPGVVIGISLIRAG